MDILENINLEDCPECGGPGLLEDEYGWCIYVACLDCGCHTAEFEYKNEEQRAQAARLAADTWNMGKAVPASPGS